MLREGYSFVLEAPWLAVAAGSAIFLIALASQMVADGLQVVLARRRPRSRPCRGPTACPDGALRRLRPGRTSSQRTRRTIDRDARSGAFPALDAGRAQRH